MSAIPAPVAENRPDLVLPLLTHDGRRLTHGSEIVRSVDGRGLATISLAPDLLIAQTLRAQEKAPAILGTARLDRFKDARQRFTDGVIDGLTLADHRALVSEVSGHNRSLCDRLFQAVAASIEQAPSRADLARPIGSVRSWEEAGCDGSGVWVRRGETLGVILSGNSPAIHSGWLQALALGYRVAVRPSRREPFTAYRIISALRDAGFRDADAVYLPSDYTGGEAVLRRAHLSLIYGGDDVRSKYAQSDRIKVGGPGRSKTFLGARHDRPDVLEQVADSVSAASGTGCVNTSSIFVEDDHIRVANDLAHILRVDAGRHRTDDSHLGPRVSEATAERLLKHLKGTAGDFDPVIPWDEIVASHPDGGVVLGPAVFVAKTSQWDSRNSELPFPCVWVVPWTKDDGITPLRHSLVVNAITDDRRFIDDLLREPTIQNVYVGRSTAGGGAHLPHEGFMGDFLMRNKATISDPPASEIN